MFVAMGWHPGQLLHAGFEGLEAPPELLAMIRKGEVGGAILFARNIDTPAQVRELVLRLHDAAPPEHPLLVSIDQEGGRVQRLRAPWTEWPPMRRFGEHDDLDATQALGEALARELRDLGIDLDFAPVVDVDTNPDNPVIGDRSFSRSPEDVGRHAVALIRGLQGEGVAACAKHFPGHGDTDVDSHLALPKVDHSLERLREVELPPFAAAAKAGVASVMTAHVIVSALDADRPATLSPTAISLLRDEIGYDGVVFSDDLDMKAVADHFTPGRRHATGDRGRLRRRAGLPPARRARRGAGRAAALAGPPARGAGAAHGGAEGALRRRQAGHPERSALRRTRPAGGAPPGLSPFAEP